MKQSTSWLIQFGSVPVSLFLLLLFAFQNCADPLNLADQDLSNFIEELPFAFDTELDTIAYMSCSEMGNSYNPRAYFTFRAGAYNSNSGIRFRKDYLSKTGSFALSQRVDALAESKINVGAIPQLSLRQSNNFQKMITISGSNSVLKNKDYVNMLSRPLDDPLIAKQLAALRANQRIQYFPGPNQYGRLLEGSLRFMTSEETAASIRTYLEGGDSLLTMTYADALTPESFVARSPEPTNPRRAYGKGYRINFGVGFGIQSNSSSQLNYLRAKSRVINSIQEVNLQGSSSKETNLRSWSCDRAYTFIIVRPLDSDLNDTGCERKPDPLASSLLSDKAHILKSIRHVLLPEDWWVDLDKWCVIPKQLSGASCYGEDTNTIDYNGGECGASDSCPHYVSVCLRN